MEKRNKKGKIKVVLIIFDLIFLVSTILMEYYWNCNKEFYNGETIINSILTIIFLLIIVVLNLTVIETLGRDDEQKESKENNDFVDENSKEGAE